MIVNKGVIECMPKMQHDVPTSVRLAPGMDGGVIWSFAKPGPFEVACLIPVYCAIRR